MDLAPEMATAPAQAWAPVWAGASAQELDHHQRFRCQRNSATLDLSIHCPIATKAYTHPMASHLAPPPCPPLRNSIPARVAPKTSFHIQGKAQQQVALMKRPMRVE